MNRIRVETATVRRRHEPWTAAHKALSISLSKHRLGKGPQLAYRNGDMRLLFGILLATTVLFGQPSIPGDLAQGLQKIAALAPDPCFPEEGQNADPSAIYRFFPAAAESIVTELNATSPAGVRPLERARGALERLEQMSAAMNGAWPEQERFHYEILDLPPAFVVTMSMASSAAYYVFAIPDGDAGKPNAQWRHFEPLESLGSNSMRTGIALHPVQRGPSGHPRFLANFSLMGCAGSFGGRYDGREWIPDGLGSLQNIIGQDQAWGLTVDDPLAGIGTLETDGPKITLPYCWFSAIDTWDMPTLCAVDTYDVSGDDVHFIGRVYNKPDLLTVAKAIEHGRAHDLPALTGYCVSSDVAMQLDRDMPPGVFGVDLKVTAERDGRERVELQSDAVYQFEIERVGERWLVVSFRVVKE